MKLTTTLLSLVFIVVTAGAQVKQGAAIRRSAAPLKNLRGPSNSLFNYGVIDAFIGGLYKGTLPVKELKLKGDFGIGAPDMLDGELLLLDGQAYQTRATGETVIVGDERMIPFASVTFFRADTIFYVEPVVEQKALLEIIGNALSNKNAMYAVKITGAFSWVRTRAFPPLKEAPFPVLSTILDRQRFFEHQNMSGTFVGFHLPEYLNGINASGFHFHFLSTDRKKGGHILDFRGQQLKVEIARLNSMELAVPQDKDFEKFEFKKRQNEPLEKVEKGK